jgi:hypothetical protein
MPFRKTSKARLSGSEEASPWYKRSAVIVAIIGGLAALTVSVVKVILPKFYGESPQVVAFRGRVSDVQGHTLGGAKVILEGKGLPPLIYTDSEGVFAFGLPPDVKEIKIRVEAPGYDLYDRRVDVSAKTELEDIRLAQTKAERKVGLSGVVVDGNERPLQGAKVSLDDLSRLAPAETSSTGVFNIEDLPLKAGDRVRLRVVLEGYQPNPYLEDAVIGDYSPTVHLTKIK